MRDDCLQREGEDPFRKMALFNPQGVGSSSKTKSTEGFPPQNKGELDTARDEIRQLL